MGPRRLHWIGEHRCICVEGLRQGSNMEKIARTLRRAGQLL